MVWNISTYEGAQYQAALHDTYLHIRHNAANGIGDLNQADELTLRLIQCFLTANEQISPGGETRVWSMLQSVFQNINANASGHLHAINGSDPLDDAERDNPTPQVGWLGGTPNGASTLVNPSPMNIDSTYNALDATPDTQINAVTLHGGVQPTSTKPLSGHDIAQTPYSNVGLRRQTAANESNLPPRTKKNLAPVVNNTSTATSTYTSSKNQHADSGAFVQPQASVVSFSLPVQTQPAKRRNGTASSSALFGAGASGAAKTSDLGLLLQSVPTKLPRKQLCTGRPRELWVLVLNLRLLLDAPPRTESQRELALLCDLAPSWVNFLCHLRCHAMSAHLQLTPFRLRAEAAAKVGAVAVNEVKEEASVR